MLQPQRTKLLGDLYYNDTPRAFIPPPVNELKALTKAKEEDYLLAKNTENQIETMLRNIPKDYSPEIYNNVVNKTRQVMSSINSDNYADKVMDVQQFANDFQNKLGVKELMDEQNQIAAANKVYDDAKAKGEIIDPEMESYYKAKTMTNRKPLSYDENGFVTKPNVKPAPYSPYVDAQKFALDTANGWKANKSVVVGADGKIYAGKDVPGYLNVKEGEEVTAEELQRGLTKALEANDKYQAYLSDYSDMKASKIPATAESVDALLPQNIKDKLFGIKDATVMDIQNAISQGRLDPKEVIKNVYKSNEIAEKIGAAVEKESYRKEDTQYLKDDLLFKSLDAQLDIAKFRAKAAEGAKDTTTNAFVTAVPETSQAVLNPTDIKDIDKRKVGLIEQRKLMQGEINAYKRNLQNESVGLANGTFKGTPSYRQETLDLKQAQQSKLDADIEELNNQQTSIRKVWDSSAAKVGVNTDKRYDALYPESVKVVTDYNKNELEKVPSMTLDITPKIVQRGGEAYIQGKDGSLINVKETGGAVVKQGTNYIYSKSRNNAISENLWKQFPDLVFDTRGSISDNVTFDSPQVSNNFYRLPTKTEYKDMGIKAYNDKESPTNMIGISKRAYTDPTTKTMFSGKMLEDTKKVRDSGKDITWQIEEPLSSILITGETTKESLRNYTNMEKAVSTSFKNTPSQYQISTSKGLVPLQTYLKETYGIEGIDSRYIDWGNNRTDARTAIQSDRTYGQKTILDIKLTKQALEDGNDALKETYGANGSLKLVGFDPRESNQTKQNTVKATVLNAYKNISNDTSAHAVDNKKEMGKVYLSNTPEGNQLNSLGLYTMAAGESKVWNVRGTQYGISTSTRDALQSDLMNVNFHLTRVKDNQTQTMATNIQTGESTWRPLQGLDADKSWNQVIYESPEDIKANVGATLLAADAVTTGSRNSESIPAIANPYVDYMNTLRGPGVATKSAKRIVKQTQASYPSTFNVTVGGKTFESRIPKQDLYDLSTEYKSRLTGVSYPYVNNAIVPKVDQLLTDYPVTITGTFRDTKSSNAPGGEEGSLHKYGAALDLKLDDKGTQLYNELQNNPSLLAKYNIIKAIQEKDHIHLEFNINPF